MHAACHLATPTFDRAAPASKKAAAGGQLVGEAGLLEVRETAKHGDLLQRIEFEAFQACGSQACWT